MIDCGKGVMKEIKKAGSGAQLVKGSLRIPCFSHMIIEILKLCARSSSPDFLSLDCLLFRFRQGIHVGGYIATQTYDFFIEVIHLISH